jgi:hypothetical protein
MDIQKPLVVTRRRKAEGRGRESGREGGRAGGREGGRAGGRQGGWEGGREGREGGIKCYSTCRLSKRSNSCLKTGREGGTGYVLLYFLIVVSIPRVFHLKNQFCIGGHRSLFLTQKKRSQ